MTAPLNFGCTDREKVAAGHSASTRPALPGGGLEAALVPEESAALPTEPAPFRHYLRAYLATLGDPGEPQTPADDVAAALATEDALRGIFRLPDEVERRAAAGVDRGRAVIEELGTLSKVRVSFTPLPRAPGPDPLTGDPLNARLAELRAQQSDATRRALRPEQQTVLEELRAAEQAGRPAAEIVETILAPRWREKKEPTS